MEKGLSFQTKFISKNLSEDVLTEIDELVLESQSVDLEVPEFTEELDDYYKRTTIGDAREICHYTTFDFSNINAHNYRTSVYGFPVMVFHKHS